MLRPAFGSAFLVVLLLMGPAHAGTASRPEITDPADDSQIFTGTLIPHLDITKAWIQPIGSRFHFIIEVATLSEVPKDAVYTFHWTHLSLRYFWRANWTADNSTFEYIGGLYQGGPNDEFGNTLYIYLQGGPSLQERLQGKITPGAPGRIEWSYPLDSVIEDRRGLTFKGLSAHTYMERGGEDEPLRVIDVAITESDYVHRFHSSSWWERLIPGPSPALMVTLLVAVALFAVGRRR